MESPETRKEFEQLAERNDFTMATIVNMRMSVRTIGGGDHVGDIEVHSTRDQFVHTSSKASLGWCIGCRAADLARQLLSDPKELMDFKAAVLNSLEEYLYSVRTELEKIDGGNE